MNDRATLELLCFIAAATQQQPIIETLEKGKKYVQINFSLLTNQLTGIYMRATLTRNGLMLNYQLVLNLYYS